LCCHNKSTKLHQIPNTSIVQTAKSFVQLTKFEKAKFFRHYKKRFSPIYLENSLKSCIFAEIFSKSNINSMETAVLERKVKQLPFEVRREVFDYMDFLIQRHRSKRKKDAVFSNFGLVMPKDYYFDRDEANAR
jgi:hypothetical protein